uniref:Guanylate cyclase activator 1C n=1 Tax=Erpetoichthys calabaricus TaxID=27687 RepID=A0A8C4RQF5_ERPCA
MGINRSSVMDIDSVDIHHWYNKFMRESPSGLLTLYELKAILGLQGMNDEANGYIEQVFATFDMNQDGFIDFVEYVAALSLILKGKIDQKLKWYFKLYDVDGNGKIDRDELLSIFKAIQAINRQTDMSPEEITNLVFEKIDVNGDGELTLEEFIDGTQQSDEIMDIVTKSLDLSNVLKVIKNGRRNREGKDAHYAPSVMLVC